MDPGNLHDLIEASYKPNAAIPATLPNRSGFYDTLKSIGSRKTTVDVNQFRITQWPRMKFYQYDITVSCSQGTAAERARETSRGDLRFLWNTSEVKEFRESISKFWLWDGNKIAWSDKRLPPPGEKSIRLDMDKVQKREPKPNSVKTIKHWQIKETTMVDFQDLENYLSGRDKFSNSVLQCINVFDQIMRQTPTIEMNEIKRSWFPKENQDTADLKRTACYVQAQKGVYCSVRLCQGGPRTGVALNVDVANAVFWTPQKLLQACCAMYGREKTGLNLNRYLEELKPVKKRGSDNTYIRTSDGGIDYEPSTAWKDLRKLSGVMVRVDHPGRDKPMLCTIAQFEFYKFAPGPSDSIEYQREHAGNYGEGGATAAKVFFDFADKDSGQTRNISVAQYWRERYKIDLSQDPWPLMRARKGGFVPMQFCQIIENQRYKFKLDPDQTSDMIKFAVTKPEQRLQSINRGIAMLKWATDPILNHIGIKIEPKCTKTDAVILQPPAIQFGIGGKEEIKKPGTSGSWRMTNTRLFKPCKPLNTWVIIILDECISYAEWKRHYDCMKNEATNLGMEIRRDPQALTGPSANIERLIDDYMARFTGKDFDAQIKNFPELFFIVVKDKNSHAYERIKSILDTKYAVHSQVVQSFQLKSKNGVNAQYASNVLLKINAKLGGTTSRACRLNKATITGNGRLRAHAQPDYLKSITMDKPATRKKLVMVIGADVSHPGSLSDAPSFAAVTMSMDVDLVRYTATCETNHLDKLTSGKDQKQGTEIIQQATFDKMKGMIDYWLKTVGSTPQAEAANNLHLSNAPAHIFYMRDGVSEGQYQYVLKQEVKFLRETLVRSCSGFQNSKITVIVASKRHHLRMLPSRGDTCIDNNGNPMPGTLVERDITHPFENDFYLVAHRAIQGTARPIHYAVLMDEGKFRPDELIDWIYASCYQFVRSTTPVSIHPAIYYAHLASKRGTAHENINFKAHGPRHGGEGHQHAMMNRNRPASAVESAEEGAGRSLPEVQKLRGLGLYWRNAELTPRERMPQLMPMYRSFAYGMWFI